MSDIEKFYESQKNTRDSDVIDAERIKRVESWLRNDTVDYWRHNRMYRFLDPFLDLYPKASWLTIGDGRYACDAQYIRKKVLDVTATDISDSSLKIAKDKGLIDKYSIENAEKISFENNSFDFVFCKESYHHFPRPMIALYEMLRVARQAVILIEPNDQFFEDSWKMTSGDIGFKDFVRMLLKRTGLLNATRRLRKFKIKPQKFYKSNFEKSGNYIYSISKLEIAKMALGIGLPVAAFAGLNDYYEVGVEFEKISEESELFKKVRKKIEDKNRKNGFEMLIAVIFKKSPDENLRKALREFKYEIEDFPPNPYLSTEVDATTNNL